MCTAKTRPFRAVFCRQKPQVGTTGRWRDVARKFGIDRSKRATGGAVRQEMMGFLPGNPKVLHWHFLNVDVGSTLQPSKGGK